MESMALAHVNPKMLIWARTRANLTLDQASQKFIDLERLTAWESGDQIPTLLKPRCWLRSFVCHC